MKKFFIILLQIFLIVPLLSSCSDDEPVDSDGFIFLEHGQKYPAQTQVSDDEILSKLCSGSWTLINGNNWLYYDKKRVSDFGAKNSNGDDFYFLNQVMFHEDGTCSQGPNHELHQTTFTVKDRVINIERSAGCRGWNVKVVAIYQGNLVVDCKAQTEMKGFDTATLMQRYIWYNYPTEE
ncbi:MAG: hypothetical protein J5523_06535 [Muribaculaceae bacterium]|nr:hypothetical protein [Muribaculaceae bacterium]